MKKLIFTFWELLPFASLACVNSIDKSDSPNNLMRNCRGPHMKA